MYNYYKCNFDLKIMKFDVFEDESEDVRRAEVVNTLRRNLRVHYNPLDMDDNALHFKEQDIDEFRECFYLFVQSRQITSLDELTLIMRSLGFSPTVQELIAYLKKYNGKMSFADFLETMHRHSKVENLPDEVIAAFKAMDTENTGTIPRKQLAHLMQYWGEGLSVREIDNIFREANVRNNSVISYSDFVKIASAPVPDYY